MSVDPCASRYYRALVSIALLFLFVVQPAGAQTISIDFAAFGAAAEDNPGDPEHPNIVLFLGQPAVFEFTITNLGEQDQTIMAGGGLGGGFTIDNATVSPEGAGECSVSEDHTFVDCPSLLVPGTGAGKGATVHNLITLLLEITALQVSTGGFSGFAGNSETGTPTFGAAVEVREATETRTLTVESAPTFVDIEVLPPRELVKTMFTREYPAGVSVSLKAPEQIETLLVPLEFFLWEIDSQGNPATPVQKETVVMDQDHSALAVYGGGAWFGRVDLQEDLATPKSADPIDIYANGYLVVDDLGEDQATAFTTVPLESTIDITDGTAPDNSNPIRSFAYESEGAPALIVITEDDQFINRNARMAAEDTSQADVALFVPLVSERTDEIRVVHRTATSQTELFGLDSPLDENGFTQYAGLPPGQGIIEVLSRADEAQLAAFQGDLAPGDAVVGILKEDDQQGFSLLLFDAEGSAVESTVVTSTNDGETMPASFMLHGNYPNPFNPETVIRFEVPSRTRVTLEVLNPLGQIIETLVDELRTAGTYAETFAAGELPSGTYFYRMTAGSFVETRSMVLMK